MIENCLMIFVVIVLGHRKQSKEILRLHKIPMSKPRGKILWTKPLCHVLTTRWLMLPPAITFAATGRSGRMSL